MHDALADLIGEQRLNHAQHTRRNRDRDHPAGVERERRRIAPDDRLEHALEQECGDDAERRRDDDQREHAAQPELVRSEEPANPPQVRAPLSGISGAGRRLLRGVKEHAHRCQGTLPSPLDRARRS